MASRFVLVSSSTASEEGQRERKCMGVKATTTFFGWKTDKPLNPLTLEPLSLRFASESLLLSFASESLLLSFASESLLLSFASESLLLSLSFASESLLLSFSLSFASESLLLSVPGGLACVIALLRKKSLEFANKIEETERSCVEGCGRDASLHKGGAEGVSPWLALGSTPLVDLVD
jgi:hypothetical protein